MDIEQIIKERMQVLPEDIRSAIKSTDLASKFDTIANKHSLHVDQNGSLQTETVLVMLGLETTEDYVENIQRELEITEQEALSVAKDVNKEIFDSIRTSLQKIQEQNDGEDSEEKNDDLSKIIPKPIQMPKPPEPTAMPARTNPVATTIQIPKPTPPTTPFIKNPTVDQVGKFTVEKPVIKTVQYNENNIDREALLKRIEDLEPEIVEPDHMIEIPIQPPSPPPEKIPEKKIENRPITTKTYTTDPYREQI